MSTSSKDDAAPSISYTEQAPDRRNIPDSVLIGTHPFSAARLWNREPLDEFYREALEKYPNETSIDPVEELKLRRKIDRLIIPCLAVCYAFYYIDKTTLSYAAIFGIKTDLKLHGTEYSWLSSLFYFGWLAWGLPSNLLMQRSPSGKYLAINIFLWGVLLMAQAASRNFTELAVLRILSGAFEAIADPAFMLITTMFYRRSEQPSRISMWYAANGVGVAGGGLLGYAIGHIKGSLASWKYEFLIVGSLCSLWAIVLFFVLPDSPATARALTREERLLAFRETFLDPKSWLFFALGLFSTLIIQGLGFDTLQTTLLGIPQGALVCIWIGLGAYLNGRLPPNSRTLVCILFMLPTIAGTLGFLLAPQDASVGRLICYYLTGSYQSSFVLGLSLITSNTAGQTKKQLTSALIWLGACVGNISGPFFYRTQDAPTYHLGIGSMLVSNCLEVLIFVALRVYLSYQNRKRDAADLAAADSGAKQGSTTTTGDVNDAKDVKDMKDMKDAKDSESLGGLSAFRPHENETAFADMTDLQNVK
ncbi:MFS general substrate transporter [Lentinula raphanica]|nr:MFS general substrate transporter [Lentinula raphanica]